MKYLKEKLIITTLALVTFGINAQVETTNEAPYFVVHNNKPGSMPLKGNHAEIYISGNIADVTLTQTYQNNSDSIIEAVYVFPGSTQSAVYGMEMQIGSRVIKAELKEKAEARKTYENAKKEGKRTSLLEQHRPNVFQMNVANILPGEQIKVRLQYTEKLIPEYRDYQFVLPTVVGPRFHQPTPDHEASFVHMPYTQSDIKPNYTYEIDIYLMAGQPIKKVSSSSHQLKIKKFSNETVHIKLSETEIYSGNKDFVLKYRLADHSISSGFLMYEHEDENFFMANIQPPNFISDAELPAREYIFIVDISGSMFGFPLEISKKLMRDLLHSLKPSDRFNVLLFAGTSYMFSDTSMYATSTNIDTIISNLEQKQGGGSTMLLPALQKALHFPRSEEGLSRSLILITDGYISVEKEAFELIKNNLNRANVFTFGIGSSTNRYLIEGLANVGQGLPFIIEKEEMACDIAEKFKTYISKPSLTNISLRTEEFEIYDVTPESIPDLLGERPINIVGKWKGAPRGKLHIDGYYAGTKYTQTIQINHYDPDPKNKALRMLWAREKLKFMDDYRKIMYDDSHQSDMIALSLKYHLLSHYTSFVAVDYEVVNNGIVKTVKQALPLPEGVSEMAIGAEMEVKKSTSARTIPYLKIGPISGPISKNTESQLKLSFLKQLRKLKKLLRNFNTGTIVITLIFDESAMLDTVEIEGIIDHQLIESLKNLIMNMDFSPLTIMANSDINVQLEKI
ncbi:VIT domain-containing protein [Portibacter marinus]|uniref:VIT domain-containing protein n=1 Tax=Portibacter marinus TaxID=2898660 RepID=UPI001F335CD6|nr:VIT domain-containing protein [Portibacter marinus]